MIENGFKWMNSTSHKENNPSTDLLDPWHPTPSKMTKLSALYNCFLRYMIKNDFKWMNTPGHKENNPSSDLLDWRHRIKNKALPNN